MELAKVEQYVSCLLESWAVYDSGEERVVWQTLHDLLMAVSRYELMTDRYKEMTTQLCKKLQHHFDTRFILKERKRKAKKEKFPPNPLLKEKQTKEKEEKPLSLVYDAKEAFRKECLKRLGQYDEQQLADFYHYWSQENSEGQMRFESERFWNIDNRLKRWVTNNYAAANSAAAERIKKSRSRQDKQQVVAQERNEANDRLWQQYADMKKGAVSHEEYLRMKEKEHESHE